MEPVAPQTSLREKTVIAAIKKVAINDPRSSIFRAYEQLLLVEEHISTKAYNCRICTFKHLSTSQALLEEVRQMDGQGSYTDWVDRVIESLSPLKFVMTTRQSGPTDSEYRDVLQKVRYIRKNIEKTWFFSQSQVAH